MSQDDELEMACEYSKYLAENEDDDDRALYALWATLEDERARREAAKSGGGKPATPPASKRTASPSTASSVRRVAPLLSSDGASVARGLCGQFTCAAASAVQGGGGEASSSSRKCAMVPALAPSGDRRVAPRLDAAGGGVSSASSVAGGLLAP